MIAGVDAWTVLTGLSVPAIAGLLWWAHEIRKEFQQAISSLRKQIEAGITGAENKLHQVELDVARNYVTAQALKTMREEVMSELREIDRKIDMIAGQGRAAAKHREGS